MKDAFLALFPTYSPVTANSVAVGLRSVSRPERFIKPQDTVANWDLVWDVDGFINPWEDYYTMDVSRYRSLPTDQPSE
jgi:hypothetical protein